MRKGWTISLFAMALLILNGCVLPPVVTLASYSVDLVTYEATGKTATDHIYSAIARSDCSFVRILRQKPICVDPPPPVSETAAAAETHQTNDAGQKTPPAGIDPATAPQSQNVTVIIGSFLDQANAERAVIRYAEWHPVITDVAVGGLAFHRVVARSLSYDEAASLKTRIVADQRTRLRFAQSQESSALAR